MKGAAGRQRSGGADANRAAPLYPYDRVSDAEFARRWRRVQGFIEDLGLRALLIAGGTGTWDRAWTNTRWAVNHVGSQLTNSGYVLFPPDGPPTVFAFPVSALSPARRAREVTEDVRPCVDMARAVVDRLDELGIRDGEVGLVETDLLTSLPANHRDMLAAHLPAVRLRSVTREWWKAVRLIRSEEEITFLERAAHIGDAMHQALIDHVAEGANERELFAVLAAEMVRQGGELPTMLLAASGPTATPFDTHQRERPMNRRLEAGDAVLTEVAPRVGDGSECQIGRTFAVGRPAGRYRELARVMIDGYDALVETLRPGGTREDVLAIRAMIERAGYACNAPLVHGAEGGAAGALPFIGAPVAVPEDQPFEFAPNMVVCAEVHVAESDGSAGVFLADTWLITEDGARCLNRFPREPLMPLGG